MEAAFTDLRHESFCRHGFLTSGPAVPIPSRWPLTVFGSSPIYKAIVAAKIGLLFSHPEAGHAIAALQPMEISQFGPGLKIDGDALQFDREYVRSLTPNELKDRLVVLGERLVASRRCKARYQKL